MRKYICTYDNGHDYGDFEFFSDHRAGSKANEEDAKTEMRHRYGYKRARHLEIKDIYLIESYN